MQSFISGNSKKYPYHTTDGFLEFSGQGGFFELEISRHGGIPMIGISKEWWVGLELEFLQGTDKSVSLEDAYFMDLISWQII